MNFFYFEVCDCVQRQIDSYKLPVDQEEVITRCVGGYSCSTCLADKVAKILYRMEQLWRFYPDWKASAAKLGEGKYSSYPGLGFRPWFNISFGTWALVDSLRPDSGDDELYKLIQENNELLLK
jgi:hypothetical protein